MGTMIQRLKLSDDDFRGDALQAITPRDLKGNSDLLVLTRPDAIAAIHAQYLEAGADIIETNTFTATSISQADYGLESLAYEINVEGARVARRVADEWTARTPDRPRFVAGSIGPTNRTLSISPDVNNAAFRASTFDEMRDAYTRAGARADRRRRPHRCCSRRSSTRSTPRRRWSASTRRSTTRGVRLPLMISVTITDRSGRTLSGQTLDAFYVSIEHARPFSVGLNCALGAREMRPYLAELARIATCYVSCYPNAGLPNAFGQYDELPDETGAPAARVRRQRLRQHHRRLLRHDAGSHPRGRARPSTASRRASVPAAGRRRRSTACSRYSGLETLVLRPDSNFQMIGERTNVTGSKRFARLVHGERLGRRRRRSRSTRCAAAPTSSTSTWTRGCSTPRRR